MNLMGFPGVSDGKEYACNAGDPGLIPPGWEDLLEKGMATHSSILVWRIPFTEESGKLQSIGSQRVGHDSLNHILSLMLSHSLAVRNHSPFGIHVSILQHKFSLYM